MRLFYLYPETIDEALIELLAEPPARRPVRRHAAAARGRRDAQAHAPRPRQGPPEARRRAPAQGRPRPHLPHRVHRRPPRRDRRPSSTSSSSSSSGRASSTRSSSATPTRRRAARTRCPARCRPLVAANRARKLMALQRRIAREKNRALIGREIDVLVEGPSEEHELVMKGRHAGQAPGHRRQRLPLRGRGPRGRDAPRADHAGERLGPRRRAAGRAARRERPGASRSRCSGAAARSRAGSRPHAAAQTPPPGPPPRKPIAPSMRSIGAGRA